MEQKLIAFLARTNDLIIKNKYMLKQSSLKL